MSPLRDEPFVYWFESLNDDERKAYADAMRMDVESREFEQAMEDFFADWMHAERNAYEPDPAPQLRDVELLGYAPTISKETADYFNKEKEFDLVGYFNNWLTITPPVSPLDEKETAA